MLGTIYIITNSINSKVYIGQTIQPLTKRWEEHCRIACSKNEANMVIKKAIFKYGKENFIIKELEKCAIEDLDKREIYYIDLYNSYNNGYNSTKGGKFGGKPLKLTPKQQKLCIDLYKSEVSLRYIAKVLNVDKGTIKHILEINNISIRTSRSYKFNSEDRAKIIEESSYIDRKTLMKKWGISKGYLSQLLNGRRRI